MDIVVRVFLPIAVGIIMLSVGLGLTTKDFTRIIRWPKSFFVGLACQILLFPLVAFGIVLIFGLSGSIAVGVMLLASCPGGNTSNLFTKFAHGNVALSVSLTAVSSLLSVATVPIIVKWAELYFMNSSTVFLDLRGIALRASLLTMLPVTIGMAIRHFSPTFANKAAIVTSRLSILLLLVIIIGAVIGNWGPFVENLLLLGGVLTSLFFLLTLLSLIIPLALGVGKDNAKTISIETGVQNGALGITVAALLTHGAPGFNDFSLASAIYGVLVYFAIFPVIVWYRFFKPELNKNRLQYE